MFGIDVAPDLSNLLNAAWALQATLTVVATLGMAARLLRRQRHLHP